jgi:hypothetical protein
LNRHRKPRSYSRIAVALIIGLAVAGVVWYGRKRFAMI